MQLGLPDECPLINYKCIVFRLSHHYGLSFQMCPGIEPLALWPLAACQSTMVSYKEDMSTGLQWQLPYPSLQFRAFLLAQVKPGVLVFHLKLSDSTFFPTIKLAYKMSLLEARLSMFLDIPCMSSRAWSIFLTQTTFSGMYCSVMSQVKHILKSKFV